LFAARTSDGVAVVVGGGGGGGDVLSGVVGGNVPAEASAAVRRREDTGPLRSQLFRFLVFVGRFDEIIVVFSAGGTGRGESDTCGGRWRAHHGS